MVAGSASLPIIICYFPLRVTPLCSGQHPEMSTSEMSEMTKESQTLSASHPQAYLGWKKQKLDFQLKGLRGSWCKATCCCENTDSNKPLHIWNKCNLQESAEKEGNLCWSNISWWLITTMKQMPPHVQTDCNQSIIKSCQTHSCSVEISLLETAERNCSLYSEWSTNKMW